MSILVIIYSKAILIKTIQTTIIMFNPFCIIASKHKSILSKSILYTAEPNIHIINFTPSESILVTLKMEPKIYEASWCNFRWRSFAWSHS